MEYVRLLAEEMALWKKTVSACKVDTIFIGGGTPSVLEPAEMDVLFRVIHDTFSLERVTEFTMECNPGTVTGEKLHLMREAGVNRISFGMQSTINRELDLLGRIHTYEEFVKSYELSRRIGFENINIDLMSSIPEQTSESYEKSLQRVVQLAPEHISSYSLIVEEGTPFFEQYGEDPPVDEDTDRNMYERTKEVLSAAGYDRYEISNYAKKGKECRHNLKYWRREDYLGVGLGAASCMGHRRFCNESSLKNYKDRIHNGQIPTAESEELTKEDEMAEFMYLGLRCMKGISTESFEQIFQEDFDARYGDTVKELVSQGLLEKHDDWIRLTLQGINLSNRVFVKFI